MKLSIKHLFLLFMFSIISWSLAAQEAGDTRYNSQMNLPFNTKAGDYNPQTGDISIGATDVALPGRGGYNFTFGRIWTLSRSNVFNMYYEEGDHMYYEEGDNRLSSNTIEKSTKLGVGWASTLPFILEDNDGDFTTLNLFLGTGVYTIDQEGIRSDRTDRSNLAGYDLLDKRIRRSVTLEYSAFDDNDYGLALTDIGYDGVSDTSSEYLLVLKNREQYWFRDDGKLMMQEDPNSNRIWYFYDTEQLALVVDTIGRQITFTYNTEGNLREISWEVEKGYIDETATPPVPTYHTETRSVLYTYQSAETAFPEIDWAYYQGEVTDYLTPYLLTAVQDPVNQRIGTETRYNYRSGEGLFTYDSLHLGAEQNLFAMITEVYSHYSDTPAEAFKNKRVFGYENSDDEDEIHRKDFYGGYMHMFRLAGQHAVTCENDEARGRVMNETHYVYHDEDEPGYYGRYQTIIKTKGREDTYNYSLDDNTTLNNVLTFLVTETDDHHINRTNYKYDQNRTLTAITVFKSDPNGNVHRVYNETYIYDLNGNLTYKEDKIGAVTSIKYYEKFNVPTEVTRYVTVDGAEEDYKTYYKIDEDRGHVLEEWTRLKDKDGNEYWVRQALNGYDNYGNLTSVTDVNDNVVTTEYDSDKLFPVRITQIDVTLEDWSSRADPHYWINPPDVSAPTSIYTWFVYNSDGTVWYEIDARGNAVGHYYDENGFEIESVKPDEDDYEGLDSTITDLKGWADFNTFLSLRSNNPGTRMYPDYQKDFLHSVSDVDLVNGLKKVFAVRNDGLGHTLSELEYEVLGAFTEDDVNDPNLQVHSEKRMTYDSLGRMIALTDPDADFSSYTEITIHDTIVQKHDKTWIIKYDDLGRKKRVDYPATQESGIAKNKLYYYNNYENSTTVINEESQVIKEFHDWNDNLLSLYQFKDSYMNEAEALVYTYNYDELNRKIRFTDSKGIVTEYFYDEQDLLKEQHYYEAGSDSSFTSDLMEYNDKGLLEKKTDGKGQIITFEYDERDILIGSRHYKSEVDYLSSISSYEVSLVLDEIGQAVRVANNSLIEHYIYDSLSRTIQLDRKILETIDRFDTSGVFSFQYTYNDDDQINEMIYPDGKVHEYSYDSLSRLSGLSEDSNVFIQNLDYTPSGVVTRMDYSNGVSQVWSFDNRKRISHIQVTDSGGTSLDDLNYTVNGVGNVTAINDDEYTYDVFNRLTGARILLPGASEDGRDPFKLVNESFGSFSSYPSRDLEGVLFEYWVGADINGDNRINGVDFFLSMMAADGLYDDETFEYDKNGNRTRLTRNGDEYFYEYGERNRLLGIRKKEQGSFDYKPFLAYGYDDNGNTSKRTFFDEFGDPTEEFFEYDVMNRLVKTTKGPAGSEVETTYFYDNMGNRFIKKKNDGSAHIYIRHGQIAVAQDYEVPALTETEFTLKENRFILSGDLLAGRVTTTTLPDSTLVAEKSYYHLDHLNSTKVVTNETGAIVVKYIYRAFGEQLKRLDNNGDETGDQAKYSYGGKELDNATNLYYFNARYYDATTGRFINVDPVQDGSNWYVYVNNNPLSFKDPTGLQSEGISPETRKALQDRFNNLINESGQYFRGYTKYKKGRERQTQYRDQAAKLRIQAQGYRNSGNSNTNWGNFITTVGVGIAGAGGAVALTGGTVTVGSFGLSSPVTVPVSLIGAGVAGVGIGIAAGGGEFIYHGVNQTSEANNLEAQAKNAEQKALDINKDIEPFENDYKQYDNMAQEMDSIKALLKQNPEQDDFIP